MKAKTRAFAVLMALSILVMGSCDEDDESVVPVAAFTSAATKLSVQFTNTSTDGDTYAWDFGDDGSSTETSPEHTYAADGSYTVTLTVTSSTGDVDTASETLEIAADAPTAAFTFISEGYTVDFTDASENAVSWAWTFGEAGTSDEQSPSFTFAEFADYEVTLVVTSAEGKEGTLTETVTTEYFGFDNGTFDDLGLNGAVDDAIYQDNSDVWQPDCDAWLETCDGSDGFRAGGMTSDGRPAADGSKTNGIKFNHSTQKRGAVQTIDVTVGYTYRVTVDAATEIVDPAGLAFTVKLHSAPVLSEFATEDLYTSLQVFGYAEGAKGVWDSYSLEFTATTESLTYLMLAGDASVDSSTEVWIDNITIERVIQ